MEEESNGIRESDYRIGVLRDREGIGEKGGRGGQKGGREKGRGDIEGGRKGWGRVME